MQGDVAVIVKDLPLICIAQQLRGAGASLGRIELHHAFGPSACITAVSLVEFDSCHFTSCGQRHGDGNGGLTIRAVATRQAPWASKFGW